MRAMKKGVRRSHHDTMRNLFDVENVGTNAYVSMNDAMRDRC